MRADVAVYFAYILLLLVLNFDQTDALLKRCFECRSRGDLGDCKDPFKFNVTQVENEPGVSAVPCASGWCGKVIEGEGNYRTDDYDKAVQRMCVQRGPSDSEDRCAYTLYNYKKVFMCFCQGDLCNSSTNLKCSYLAIFLSLLWSLHTFINT